MCLIVLDWILWRLSEDPVHHSHFLRSSFSFSLPLCLLEATVSPGSGYVTFHSPHVLLLLFLTPPSFCPYFFFPAKVHKPAQEAWGTGGDTVADTGFLLVGWEGRVFWHDLSWHVVIWQIGAECLHVSTCPRWWKGGVAGTESSVPAQGWEEGACECTFLSASLWTGTRLDETIGNRM